MRKVITTHETELVIEGMNLHFCYEARINSGPVIDDGIGSYEYGGCCSVHHDYQVEEFEVDEIFNVNAYGKDYKPVSIDRLPADLLDKLLKEALMEESVRDQILDDINFQL